MPKRYVTKLPTTLMRDKETNEIVAYPTLDADGQRTAVHPQYEEIGGGRVIPVGTEVTNPEHVEKDHWTVTIGDRRVGIPRAAVETVVETPPSHSA